MGVHRPPPPLLQPAVRKFSLELFKVVNYCKLALSLIDTQAVDDIGPFIHISISVVQLNVLFMYTY